MTETEVEKFAKEKVIVDTALAKPKVDDLREKELSQYIEEKAVIERALAKPPDHAPFRRVKTRSATEEDKLKQKQFLEEREIIARAIHSTAKPYEEKSATTLDSVIARALNSQIKPTKSTRDKGYIENIISTRKELGKSVEPDVMRDLIITKHSEYLWYIDGLTVDEAKLAIDNCDVALSFILKDKLFKQKAQRLALAKHHLSKGYNVSSVPIELFNDALVNVAIKNSEKIIAVYAHLYGFYKLQEKQLVAMIKKDYNCLNYDETLSQILAYVHKRIKSQLNPVSFIQAFDEVKNLNGSLTGIPAIPNYLNVVIDFTGENTKNVSIEQVHEIYKNII